MTRRTGDAGATPLTLPLIPADGHAPTRPARWFDALNTRTIQLSGKEPSATLSWDYAFAQSRPPPLWCRLRTSALCGSNRPDDLGADDRKGDGGITPIGARPNRS